MIYNSQDTYYKYPYGAVEKGTIVTFRITPQRRMGLGRIYLCYCNDLTNEQFTKQLNWISIKDDSDLYEVTLDTSELLGPVWYWFSFEVAGKHSGYFGKDSKEGAAVFAENPLTYQLTVYEKTVTPDWYGRGVTYQIFPDRFNRHKIPAKFRNRVIHNDWNDCPVYAPNKEGEILNNDFFGGSIQGIIEKLPYIESMGVSTIYLSPIFEAYSNHRYDTASYEKVDPMLGNNEDFEELCAKSAKLGIRIILDGVFNHTGYDSIYFNGRGTYDTVGAAQSKDSPYFDWYEFQEWPKKYSSWWGIYTLPQVNESNKGYMDYIIENSDSIAKRWIKAGVSGWRLDVADELPDEFIERLRIAVREENPDAILIGEVWEDASNKVAYDVRRKYLLGKELDGVMNYPFRDSTISFVLGGSACDFKERMENLRENYPRDAYFSLMNSLGTHDTPRILTVLGADSEDWGLDKKKKAESTLSKERLTLATARLKMAAAIMFAFPGSPCVYYGDEAGVEGFEDPLNRRTFPWGNENAEITNAFKTLGAARKSSMAMQTGDIVYRNTGRDDVLMFERVSGIDHVFCVANNGSGPFTVKLENTTNKNLLTGIEITENEYVIEGMTAVLISFTE